MESLTLLVLGASRGASHLVARVLRAARALRGYRPPGQRPATVAIQAPEDMRPGRGCSCHDLALPICRYGLESL